MGSANAPDYGVEDAANYGLLTLGDGTRETVATEPGDYKRYYAGVAEAIARGGADDALVEGRREARGDERHIGLHFFAERVRTAALHDVRCRGRRLFAHRQHRLTL